MNAIEKRIMDLMEEKGAITGAMGTEPISVSFKLTEQEREEFDMVEWPANFWWEFDYDEFSREFNVLHIVQYEQPLENSEILCPHCGHDHVLQGELPAIAVCPECFEEIPLH